jgi:putative nucleotidyltransferase with HDIG domain
MQKSDLTIPQPVIDVGNQLQEAGYEAFLVGGCVRDLLIDRTPKDWDIATNATPEEMLQIFDSAKYDNSFGTVRVINDTKKTEITEVEITTYRTEDIYSDNRHPDNVEFSDSIHADLKRRDFTINALALDITNVSRDNNTVYVTQETIVDDHGGLTDLQKSRLKAVGNARERMKEDPLRIMRGIRFVSELGLVIGNTTQEAFNEGSHRLNDIAVERIRDEFEKIIMSPKPRLGITLSEEVGALSVFLPELVDTIGIEQNQAHEYDLWHHLVNTLQVTANKGWPEHIRLAGLFHDIAKKDTREWDEDRGDWSFHNHEVVGARITDRIMQRLKFSNDLTESVVNLVRWHMFFSDTDEITHSAVRRVIRNVGKDNIWDLMKLRRADRLGMGRPKEQPYRLRKYQSMVEEVIRDPVSVQKLAIDGDDVIRVTDENPGPRIGYILHSLLEDVLEDPNLNEEDKLLAKAKELSQLNDTELEKKGQRGKKKKDRKEKEAKQKIRENYHVE